MAGPSPKRPSASITGTTPCPRSSISSPHLGVDPSNISARVHGHGGRETKNFLSSAAVECRNVDSCPDLKVLSSDLDTQGNKRKVRTYLPVNTGLTNDAVGKACECKHYHQGGVENHFVIASGDRDFRCVVKMANEFGFPVHVWAWGGSMSEEYLEDIGCLPGVTVSFLDEHIERITQTSEEASKE